MARRTADEGRSLLRQACSAAGEVAPAAPRISSLETAPSFPFFVMPHPPGRQPSEKFGEGEGRKSGERVGTAEEEE